MVCDFIVLHAAFKNVSSAFFGLGMFVSNACLVLIFLFQCIFCLAIIVMNCCLCFRHTTGLDEIPYCGHHCHFFFCIDENCNDVNSSVHSSWFIVWFQRLATQPHQSGILNRPCRRIAETNNQLPRCFYQSRPAMKHRNLLPILRRQILAKCARMPFQTVASVRRRSRSYAASRRLIL